MKVTIINAGGQTDYVYGLISGLSKYKLQIDLIDSDKSLGLYDSLKNVCFLNLRGSQDPESAILIKINRILRYYLKLIKYTMMTDSYIYHIQWLNYFLHFDRTLLMLFYRILGKKIIFTAHNISDKNNIEKSMSVKSVLNHLTLKIMYMICHHIIVHNNYSKKKLIKDFNIDSNKISIIPHGINNKIPQTSLSCIDARRKLGFNNVNLKIILFFGHILPYKGLDLLIEAFKILTSKSSDYRLIIAGACYKYKNSFAEIVSRIERYGLTKNVVIRLGFVPDEEVEVLFKAAGCIVLPYRNIYQTGISFLALSFGLPQIVNDVGALKENVKECETGFICRKINSKELAKTIEKYFNSELYKNLSINRIKIRDYGFSNYSWNLSAQKTYEIYHRLS